MLRVTLVKRIWLCLWSCDILLCHGSHKLSQIIYKLNYFSFEYTLLKSLSQFLLLRFFLSIAYVLSIYNHMRYTEILLRATCYGLLVELWFNH